MCTAVSFMADSHYFGRTLDFEISYGEGVTVVPREYPFRFRYTESLQNHYALIGMAVVKEGYPLYFDGMNEYGLCMAGLLFSNNAVYLPVDGTKQNVTPFEFIPWVLAQCKTVEEAAELCGHVNLVDEAFDQHLPLTPLHWMVADESGCFVVEPLKDGVQIIQNPVGVMTNNPPFPYQLLHLSDYMHLSNRSSQNTAFPQVVLQPYSRGMGAKGLPGDFSSASRFVRAAFVKNHMLRSPSIDGVTQFFHILHTVQIPKGCVLSDKGKPVFTTYSCCYDVKEKAYCFNTYDHIAVSSVRLLEQDLQSDQVTFFAVDKYQNREENSDLCEKYGKK